MKTFAILTLSLLSLPAFSGELVTRALLQELDSADQIPHFGVYVDKRVSHTAVTDKVNSEVSQGDLKRQVDREVTKKILKPSVRGKIIYIEDQYPGEEDGLYLPTSLSVSFDSNCQTVECSYTFNLVNGKYRLAGVPGPYEQKIKYGNLGLAKEVFLEYRKDELLNITKKKEYADGHE